MIIMMVADGKCLKTTKESDYRLSGFRTQDNRSGFRESRPLDLSYLSVEQTADSEPVAKGQCTAVI